MRPSLARTPPGDLVIRPARAADAKRLAAIHLAAIREGCASHYDPEQLDAWTVAIDERLHRASIKEQVVLVAERRLEIVGFGEYQPRNGQIVHLFVDPQVAARGLGTRILEALEARATADGVTEIRLRASLNAADFYASRGYLEGAGPRTVAMQGVMVPCLPMRKPVGGGPAR